MQPLTFYTNPHSRGKIIRWLLEECGAEYETVPVPYGENGTKSAAYLAVNPMGKLPAIRYGDTVITETAALVVFLAELFPEKRLIPAAGTAERGEFYRWLMFGVHCEYAMFDKWFAVPETPERKRGIGYGSFSEATATLANFLRGRTYALGNRFTALDIYLSGLIAFGIARAQVLPADGELAAYMQRHTAHHAFARAQALDAELAKQMGLA
ncbi:glutathione S-transferase family protein [Eikenella sp. S3360]|uniref:Glutathione S-transferase family protein n=1 Tax=Eikenella glucosivorans TaxID=2766967 RepID=A0ABS0N7F2_9NEIS|nr:glutathione S-transferase family protein [Eikenella glucosivorans]MBH5328221.1 glutathione S-transferase family protein [Eikenella glucosivorans]